VEKNSSVIYSDKKDFWKDRQTALGGSYVGEWEYQLRIDPHAELCTHIL